MTAITVTFRCGHHQIVGPDADIVICPQCGERRVARVVAPPPRFRGVATGPSAVEAEVGSGAVHLAPGGPLPIKKG